MYEAVIEKLYQEYTVRGFLSEDYIFDILEENEISLFDIEYICDYLLTKGVIIRDVTLPNEDDEEYDRSNIDYEEVYREILEIDCSLCGLIDYIREIQAPQHREWQNLMPQVHINAFARNRIFEMYMRVAIRIALTYAKRYQLPLDDTIQNALMGLHISIDKYGASRQENFSQFFPFWVRQCIMREAQTLNPSVYFPAHVKEKLFAIYDNVEDYFGSFEYRSEPGKELLQSISNELECSIKEASQLLDYLQPFESLEELMEQNEQMFSDNGIENEKMIASFELWSCSSDLLNKIKCLKSREQDVLLLRFGIGCEREYTLEEIGNRLHITRERVRQIENKAIRKMRYLYGLGTERKNKLKK